MAACLDLWVNGRLVGHVDRARGGALALRYAPDWLGWPHSFPVSLSMPLRARPHAGAVVAAYLDNLLPDDPRVRARIAQRTGAAGIDAVSLLEQIGVDCAGAVQFFPAGKDPGLGKPRARPISDVGIGALLRGLGAAPLGIRGDDGFRTALAGTTAKTGVLRLDGDWVRPEGATPATHILKAQGAGETVENEYLCLAFCRAMGADVARAEIMDFDGERALCVERFDRMWTDEGRLLRLPQEDLCQALGVPPGQRFQTDGGPGVAEGLRLLAASDRVVDDQAAFLRAQVLNWLLGAGGGHAKAFSVLHRPGGGMRLAPLYGVRSQQRALIDGGVAQIRLAMGWDGGFDVRAVGPDDLRASTKAGRAGRALVDAVFDDAASRVEGVLHQVWIALPDGFPRDLAEIVLGGVQARARLLVG